MKLNKNTQDKVAHAGELLIRAAAVLGTLSPEEQEQLRQATDGALPDTIVFAIRGAQGVSAQIAESLLTHPPVGLVNTDFINGARKGAVRK